MVGLPEEPSPSPRPLYHLSVPYTEYSDMRRTCQSGESNCTEWTIPYISPLWNDRLELVSWRISSTERSQWPVIHTLRTMPKVTIGMAICYCQCCQYCPCQWGTPTRVGQRSQVSAWVAAPREVGGKASRQPNSPSPLPRLCDLQSLDLSTTTATTSSHLPTLYKVGMMLVIRFPS